MRPLKLSKGPPLALLLGFSTLTLTSCPVLAQETEINASAPSREYHRFAVGLRAMYGWKAIGAMGGAIDGAYYAAPMLGFGAQFDGIIVDNGANGHYCNNCLQTGSFILAFAELRLPPEPILSPYLRLGLGAGSAEVTRDYRAEEGLAFAAQGELGLALYLSHFNVRAFGYAVSFYDLVPGVGLQLGASF